MVYISLKLKIVYFSKKIALKIFFRLKHTYNIFKKITTYITGNILLQNRLNFLNFTKNMKISQLYAICYFFIFLYFKHSALKNNSANNNFKINNKKYHTNFHDLFP